MKKIIFLFLTVFSLSQAHAVSPEVRVAFQKQQYFTAARIAFNEVDELPSVAEKADAYAWITISLMRAGMDQSAVFFFLRTLALQDQVATQKVLEVAPDLIDRIGVDFLRKYLIRYTKPELYRGEAKNALILVQTKISLLQNDWNRAESLASQISAQSRFYAVGIQMRAAARSLAGKNAQALEDFKLCASLAQNRPTSLPSAVAGYEDWARLKAQANLDLRARCLAGQARVLYEMERFDDADRAYDEVPKASFVWTDTLFEHAWNSFARQEYNRTLGKLVSYKSPALSFVFNSEVDVLRAQSYMALCLYDDASQSIQDFKLKYDTVGKEIKSIVETNQSLESFYGLGRRALNDKLHTSRDLHRFMNRFVRAPYFQSLALSEDRVASERLAIERLDRNRPAVATGSKAGFPGFLNKVLDWRLRSIRALGGVFVKNSMMDYHSILISDYEKITFMNIDLLSQMKQKIQQPELASSAERGRGNRTPERRGDQYLWNFNGEFWNDEIGDYVFALESQCSK